MNKFSIRGGMVRGTALILGLLVAISGCTSSTAKITDSNALWSSFAQGRSSEAKIPKDPAELIARSTIIFRGYVTKIKPAFGGDDSEGALFEVNVTEVIKGDAKPGNFEVLVWSPNKVHDGTPAGQTGDALWFLEPSGLDYFMPASSRGIWAANDKGPVRTVLDDTGSESMIPADVTNLDEAVTLIKGLEAK